MHNALIMWYGQGGYQGAVADAGSDQDVRFTGWSTRNSGRGNHWHGMGGFAFALGNLRYTPFSVCEAPCRPMPLIPSGFDGWNV